MFDLDQETIDALKEYNDMVIALAHSADLATKELLEAHKNLTIAGQGLQGFIADIKARAGERPVKITKDF